jgi:hypothetical protein
VRTILGWRPKDDCKPKEVSEPYWFFVQWEDDTYDWVKLPDLVGGLKGELVSQFVAANKEPTEPPESAVTAYRKANPKLGEDASRAAWTPTKKRPHAESARSAERTAAATAVLATPSKRSRAVHSAASSAPDPCTVALDDDDLPLSVLMAKLNAEALRNGMAQLTSAIQRHQLRLEEHETAVMQQVQASNGLIGGLTGRIEELNSRLQELKQMLDAALRSN